MIRALDYNTVHQFATVDQIEEFLEREGLAAVGLVSKVELAGEGYIDVTFWADERGEPTTDLDEVAIGGVPPQVVMVTRRMPCSRIPDWWPV